MPRTIHEKVVHALTFYVHALSLHGFTVPDPGDPGGPTVTALCGQGYYVVRYYGWRLVDDLPGFVGTIDGSGFATRREAVAAINAATNTLYQLAEWRADR